VRVFLDANVLFSASNSGSNIAWLIQLLLERGAAVTSDFALEEARRNINLKRSTWAEDFQQLASRVEVVPSVRFELAIELDDKDLPILCTAIHAGCQALATGDKRHFGHLYGQVVSGVRVVPLVELAQMLTTDQPD
jgi:predicted nucleic acid-binding protein